MYATTVIFILGLLQGKKDKKETALKSVGWVLTKRERRKAGEDMETVSCERKMLHIRAGTQKCFERLKKRKIMPSRVDIYFIA